MGEFDRADEYFNRSHRVAAGGPQADLPVRYAVFCRRAGLMCGVGDVLAMIDARCTGPVSVRGLADGERFAANEIVLLLEGPFGQLVRLETECLGMLSLSAAAANMAAIVEAAAPAAAIDMSARHYPPEIIGPIAAAAAVGGAAGTSTRAGHAAVMARFGTGDDQIRIGSGTVREFKVYGTIPHALNAVFGGDSVLSAEAYLERCPEVPLTVLLDYEGREREVCVAAVRKFGSRLAAVRLDTPGNRVHQGGHANADRALEMRILSRAPDRAAAVAALEKYGFGCGVTIEAVYAIRDLLDSLGGREVKIVVSSGFDLDKVWAFRACQAPMDYVGTGSWVEFGMFTSDIIEVFEQGRWTPRCKVGRREELIERSDLRLLLNK